MLRLGLITLLSFLIATQARAAEPRCSLPAPTKIDIDVRSEKLKYDVSRPMAALQGIDTNTIDPYGTHNGTSVTQGYMEGGVNVASSASVGTLVYPGKRVGCVWFDTVEVTLTVDPTIVLAKEVNADKCMRSAVLAHEKKHVNVDRRVLNLYAEKLGKNLHAALEKQGFIIGPIPESTIENTAKAMQRHVFKIVEREREKMDAERMKRQQAVDTKEEYDKVSALCPDFKAPEEAVKAKRLLTQSPQKR